MQEVTYRQLHSADVDDYRRIRLESLEKYPDNFGSIYQEEARAKQLKLDGVIRQPGDNGFAFGAFAPDGRLIGICGCVAGERAKTRHRSEIVHMFVDPSYAGRGTGKKLLTLSIAEAFKRTHVEQLTLGVVATNERAIRLYKQVGFVEYGRLANYFKSGNASTAQAFLVLNKTNART